MAYWKKGDRVVLRSDDRRQIPGTVVKVGEETERAVSRLGKLLRRKVSTGERVKVRCDDGREGEYLAMDLDRKL